MVRLLWKSADRRRVCGCACSDLVGRGVPYNPSSKRCQPGRVGFLCRHTRICCPGRSGVQIHVRDDVSLFDGEDLVLSGSFLAAGTCTSSTAHCPRSLLWLCTSTFPRRNRSPLKKLENSSEIGLLRTTVLCSPISKKKDSTWSTPGQLWRKRVS